MGTISDKLMRIINTKEDIRRALISKGYDVPTSIPFKEYAKMILDLPCNADSFPDIEGIVARYSALGLTNEQMAENPVWKDLTGNGHDLQMKNFAWKGMSGVGGYGDENYQTFYKFTLDDYFFIATPPGVKHMNFTFRVTGLQPGNKLTLAFFGTTNTVYGTWNKDGIYTVDADIVEAGKPTYFYNGYGSTRGEFTIEILPLYPGFILVGFARAAIAGQTICNGYFSTDEDDEKVLDWYKKQYPWLFPDQAWTVTGKTNEDKDRATIANITGNGNDLVLSNFGFAEGSGYGLYAYNFNSFNLRDNVVKPTDVKKDSFRIIGTGNSSNLLILTNESDSANWKIRITGMKEGDSCIVGNANKSGDYIKIIKDGIYTFQKQYAATSINGIWYNSSQEVDVLVEQIPEYEGYLITDGVDDKVQSSSFTMNEDWTIVGDWELLSNVQINCGIVKAQNVYLYNTANGLLISINNPRSLQSFGTKSLHAICSDGRLYDRNWVEYEYTVDQNFEIVESSLNIGFNLNNYTQIAFKNLGIYNNQILSKDDCIKAYNYLQTLKSK